MSFRVSRGLEAKAKFLPVLQEVTRWGARKKRS